MEQRRIEAESRRAEAWNRNKWLCVDREIGRFVYVEQKLFRENCNGFYFLSDPEND